MRSAAWECGVTGRTVCEECVTETGATDWERVNPWDWEPDVLATCDRCGATVCNTETVEDALCEEMAADRVASTLVATMGYNVGTVETGNGIYCLRVHRDGLHRDRMRFAYVGPYDADGNSEFGEPLITVAPGAADGTLYADGITVGRLADVVDMVNAILI